MGLHFSFEWIGWNTEIVYIHIYCYIQINLLTVFSSDSTNQNSTSYWIALLMCLYILYYSRLKCEYRNYILITFEILVSTKSEKGKHIISNKNL